MSLICDETNKDIEYGQPLKASTRRGAIFFSALGPHAIGGIPDSVRRKDQCDPEQGGVDIHEASSSLNLNGSYTLCGFEIGEFLFSLSQKDAEKYLPNHIKKFNRLIAYDHARNLTQEKELV
jgi:hypothetical protein